MIKLWISNWRTTSLGFSMIIGSTVHLVFSCIHGVADEKTWEASLIGIMTGSGFLFAGDQAFSAQSHEESTSKITELQNTVASMRNGDTDFLTKNPTLAITKPDVAQIPKTP